MRLVDKVSRLVSSLANSSQGVWESSAFGASIRGFVLVSSVSRLGCCVEVRVSGRVTVRATYAGGVVVMRVTRPAGLPFGLQ